MLLVIILSLP